MYGTAALVNPKRCTMANPHPTRSGPIGARRARGSLSRDRVIEAALALVDAEGAAALTMPALARTLGCGVMTLYGYVDSKEDLLAALAQRALAELRLPDDLPADAGDILRIWGMSLRSTFLDHPSLPAIFLSQPVVGPGILYGLESLLAALNERGHAPRTAVRAVYAVVTYAVGFVAWEAPRTRQQTQAVYAATWRQAFAALPPDDLPLTATVLDQLGEVANEKQFTLGLNALVAGLIDQSVAQAPQPDLDVS